MNRSDAYISISGHALFVHRLPCPHTVYSLLGESAWYPLFNVNCHNHCKHCVVLAMPIDITHCSQDTATHVTLLIHTTCCQ